MDVSSPLNNQDGSINSSANPAAKVSYVSLYLTGTGPLERSVGDGEVAGVSLARLTVPVTAEFVQQMQCDFICASTPAEVYYAGSSPGIVFGERSSSCGYQRILLAEFETRASATRRSRHSYKGRWRLRRSSAIPGEAGHRQQNGGWLAIRN